jgi:putative transposase
MGSTPFSLAERQAAFRFGQPEIWNSDQGPQFTAADLLVSLKRPGIAISMDGRDRALDNVSSSACALERYFRFYNYRR